MKARAFLKSMRRREVVFYARGGRLHWFAPSPLASGELAEAGALKAGLIALVEDVELEARCAGAGPEEAAYLREERAGIQEHDGGLCRGEAELRAGLTMDPTMDTPHRNTGQMAGKCA